MTEKNESRIDRSMSIVGKVRSLGHVVIEGKVEGDLDCTSMKIVREGTLLGDIHAEEIECFGTIEGRIKTRKFIMRKDGCHTGTVETTELRVEPGAFLDCALHDGGEVCPSGIEKGGREGAETGVSGESVVDWERLAAVFESNAQQCIMDVPWSERRELLHQVLTLLEKEKPLIKITGDPGSGKSTLIARLKEVLPDETDLFILEKPVGSVRDLLSAVAGYLQLPVLADDRQRDIVGKIKGVIAPDGCIRKKMVLAVDDAQLMYPATMEGVIRLLTSAYEGGEALVQIILLGTGEMEGKLVHTTREYFEDETNCLLALEPLSIKDTSEYLRFCLQIEVDREDLDPVELLPFETLKKLYTASDGNIRLINNLVAGAFRRASQSGSPFVAVHHIHQ